jgi:hypothetical protein
MEQVARRKVTGAEGGRRQRLVYQSSYLPKHGTFKQLSSSEMREAKQAFAANARSERLSLAYAR